MAASRPSAPAAITSPRKRGRRRSGTAPLWALGLSPGPGLACLGSWPLFDTTDTRHPLEIPLSPIGMFAKVLSVTSKRDRMITNALQGVVFNNNILLLMIPICTDGTTL
jgi:hypothetical protein